MPVLKMTEEKLPLLLRGRGNCGVLEFYADWCKPCLKVMPVIESLASRFREVGFYKINADEEERLMLAFKVTMLPTLVFFKDGIVKDVLVGVVGESEILESLEKIKYQK